MNSKQKKWPVQIINMSIADLKTHFKDFLDLFAENTRGHVTDQVIEDSYIKNKADETFDYLKKGQAILLGLFVNNKLAGFLWAYPRLFLEEQRLYINSLIIDKAYRGRQYGKALMDEIERIALEKNIYVIDVSTASFKTDAIRFYEKLGYKHERVQLRKGLTR